MLSVTAPYYSGRLPTNPCAPNIAVLPNEVTMPIGVAVECQVEFAGQFGESIVVKADTRTQCVQVFDGAAMRAILCKEPCWMCNPRSWESPTFNHANSPNWQICVELSTIC
jgi:hypothetical protein